MQAVSNSEVEPVDVGPNPGDATIRNYYGRVSVIDREPQGFLVDMTRPGATIHPHFHDVDQFQVIVRGDGRLGKKPLEPITFHYADAFTPYGPIVSNDDGIAFFTLRLAAAGGHFSMPGSKHLMQRRAGRNLVSTFDLGRVPAPGMVEIVDLIELQPDGARAVGVRIGPGTTAEMPPSNGGGQYIIVGSGAVEVDGKMLERHSLLLVEAGESPAKFAATDEGAEVLVLQFPRPGERPGSDPNNLRRPEDYVAPPGMKESLEKNKQQ